MSLLETEKELRQVAEKNLADLITFMEGGQPETYNLHIKVKVDELKAANSALKWHQEIAALAEGYDEEGATGPRRPLTWETIARMALDYSRWALKESGVNAEPMRGQPMK